MIELLKKEWPQLIEHHWVVTWITYHSCLQEFTKGHYLYFNSNIDRFTWERRRDSKQKECILSVVIRAAWNTQNIEITHVYFSEIGERNQKFSNPNGFENLRARVNKRRFAMKPCKCLQLGISKGSMDGSTFEDPQSLSI